MLSRLGHVHVVWDDDGRTIEPVANIWMILGDVLRQRSRRVRGQVVVLAHVHSFATSDDNLSIRNELNSPSSLVSNASGGLQRLEADSSPNAPNEGGWWM